MSEREWRQAEAGWRELCAGDPSLAEAVAGRFCAQGDAEGLRRFLGLEIARGIGAQAVDAWAIASLCARQWEAAAALLERPGRSPAALSLGLVCGLTLDRDDLVLASAQGINALGEQGREIGRQALERSREIAGLELHYDSDENEKARERVSAALSRFERALLQAALPSAEPAARRAPL